MLDRDQDRGTPGVSRRSFLKGSGVAVAASAVVTGAQEAVQAAAESAAGSAAREITLTVNGQAKKLSVEPRVTLLEALRNDLKMTGCKEVCTTANCGACTVLIDGKPVYSCTRFAVAEVGKKIETPEAFLGAKPDAVIEGFIKHDATQCGYCTPGFVVATRAFLNENPKATLEEIQKGLGGNLCRCGTYANITACAVEIVKNAKGGA